jgi:ABC-type nickel/cobalt efflux system permease component RcnA
MSLLAPAALFGLVWGLRHAIEADHVAAVSAIVARERTVRGAALIGAAWGMGHTLTLLLLGGAIVAFGLVVPPRIALSLELGVGLMLIGLGAWNFVSRKRARGGERGAAAASGDATSLHEEHGAHAHGAHAHDHEHDAAHDTRGRGALATVRRALRPLVVGSMHGLAGSAAAALLVVATVRSTSWGLAYLFVFGVGTMLGMTLLTAALALPLGSALRRFRGAETWVRIGSGAVSCAIGAFVVYQIGFRDGLFLQ